MNPKILPLVVVLIISAWSTAYAVRSASPSTGITDPERVLTPASLALPAIGEPVTDPVFGTTLRRVSDRSDRDGFESQIYSQLQAFSGDNRYLLLTGSDGYRVVQVDDFGMVTGLDTAQWNAPRWHPTDIHIIVHYDSNEDTTLRVQFTDVARGQTETIFTFPAPYERIRNNQSFDELSRAGRWLAGMASQSDGTQMIFALDLQNRQLGAQFSVASLYTGPCAPDPEWGAVEPDWIGVSPLGRYLVIQWTRDGTARCSGLETFDLQSGAFVGRVYDGHAHGDLGVLPDGNTEFFMTFELNNPDANGQLSIGYRILPGTATVQEPVYVQVMDWHAAHISCQGPDGVCLVTTDAVTDNGWQALEGELFLQYSDGRVGRLVHHRSSSCGYWVQPRATLSRDGRYAVFASDWGRANDCNDGELGQGDPIVLDLRTPSTPESTDTPTTPLASPSPSPSPTVTATIMMEMYLPLAISQGPSNRTPTATRTPTSTATQISTSTPTTTQPAGGGFVHQLIDDQIVHDQGLTVVDLDRDGDEDVLASLSLTVEFSRGLYARRCHESMSLRLSRCCPLHQRTFMSYRC